MTTLTSPLRVLVVTLTLALAASLLVLVGPLAKPAQTQSAAPPTLTDEVLVALTSRGNPPGYPPVPDEPGEVTVTAVNCNETSQGEGTISYVATGPATGPYPGTFTERGTFTVGPQPPPAEFGPHIKQVTSFEAAFEIVSEATDSRVTGTKSAVNVPVPVTPGTACYEGLPGNNPGETWDGVYRAFLPPADVRYEAQIETPSGTFVDWGGGRVRVSSDTLSSPDGEVVWEYLQFAEVFKSDLAEPEPLLPTTKEQCKNGGYEQFGFKNQGECIRAVEGKKIGAPGATAAPEATAPAASTSQATAPPASVPPS